MGHTSVYKSPIAFAFVAGPIGNSHSADHVLWHIPCCTRGIEIVHTWAFITRILSWRRMLTNGGSYFGGKMEKNKKEIREDGESEKRKTPWWPVMERSNRGPQMSIIPWMSSLVLQVVTPQLHFLFPMVMISFSPAPAQTLCWLFSPSDTVNTYWGSGAVCWLVIELCPWTLLGPSLDLLSLGALCAWLLPPQDNTLHFSCHISSLLRSFGILIPSPINWQSLSVSYCLRIY